MTIKNSYRSLAGLRLSTVHAAEGYEGQVVVCVAKFLPVAGYDPKQVQAKFQFRVVPQGKSPGNLSPVLGFWSLTEPLFPRPWVLAF